MAEQDHESESSTTPLNMSLPSRKRASVIRRIPEPEETKDTEDEADVILNSQMGLLKRRPDREELDEILSAPLFTYPVLKHAETLATTSSKTPFSQYALFAGEAHRLQHASVGDPRIFYNVSTPSSIFICGSQGSGKSHSLSCMLENCLIPSSRLGRLPSPLTGIVFHYDTFNSESGGTPCEAAYLASNLDVKVRVLCSRTNIRTIRDTYKALDGVTVEELRLAETNLNTQRMLELMAFGDRSPPLYMHVIQRILREMRIDQQNAGSNFEYADFKRRLEYERLTPDQMRPLTQRLETLESFMASPTSRLRSQSAWMSRKDTPKPGDTDWTPEAGQLIIVDLSCPCVTSTMACSLFNICLSIFLEQESSIGRVIALDEAHKYMGDTAECETLTNNLLSAIRLQRHLGARIIISTQEPTISPKLLDLCSITIVHRFTSPSWLGILTKHLAGISALSKVTKSNTTNQRDRQQDRNEVSTDTRDTVISSDDSILMLFSQIVELKTGEALVFAPNAMISSGERIIPGEEMIGAFNRQAHQVMRIIVRSRITTDGGQSVMAV
ncbi:uncharacterized protein F4822DRAFT_303706 [Hypoxylon trugodes]|uniref:uncharacterized protein n=1 Tax=Hypoxylon trugodes TaxID=326681 RepID=UPI002191AB45|nr:uncharacterized protein F4822DRAFT_303706 [Hypoxylon trugodes]KAI1388151.1 hypothetical protein F4822DRAFT_303706 [Hypoxylon trugodes]